MVNNTKQLHRQLIDVYRKRKKSSLQWHLFFCLVTNKFSFNLFGALYQCDRFWVMSLTTRHFDRLKVWKNLAPLTLLRVVAYRNQLSC